MNCEKCNGTGWVNAKNNAVERCDCVGQGIKAKRIEEIPPGYRDVRVDTLEAQTDNLWVLTERQAAAIAAIKDRPHASYFFLGPTGVGKSHLLWALYREAVEAGAQVLFQAQMAELVEEWRRQSTGDVEVRPRLTPNALQEIMRAGRTPRIFIDELDKVNITEFVQNSFRGVIDTLSRNVDGGRVQLVIATNLDRNEFSDHYGSDTLRRVEGLCTTIDFHTEVKT